MITQKFYPITITELTSLSGKLTETEIVIYLYLMAANPFGDRLQEFDTSVIAENLGVSRRTVQRTLKKLESLNLIELEIKSFTYRRKEGENTEELGDSRIAKRQQDRQGDSRIAKATVGSPKRQQDRQGDSRIAKATVGSPKRQQDRQNPYRTKAQKPLRLLRLLRPPRPQRMRLVMIFFRRKN
jgi:DNA-binding MarR family transcriptional regulator